MFSYPENVLNWLKYLRVDEEWNPLKKIFENDKYTVFTLMKEMNEFFRKRDSISSGKERGDRLKISEKNGDPYNIEGIGTASCQIKKEAVTRIIKFMNLIGEMTNFKYNSDDWNCWDNLQFYKFTKKDFSGDKIKINLKSFNALMSKRPLSWAMTSGTNIEYTLELPDKFGFAEYGECLFEFD
jgi:hypothetical protein